MDETTNLLLPYILAAQAQKHVTHNEALRKLDAIVQLSVADRDLSFPPASPSEGARYIVAAPASGAWDGHSGKIAAWQDAAWAFYAPREGWIAWVEDENAPLVWDGASWAAFGGGGGGSGSFNPVSGGLVGINATANTTNRLSVASPASLFNHEGAGHQAKINKAAATDTASLLFQTGFSGRAEMGTAGDDDFHVKVSPDGSAWNEAILIDKDTGAVSFPNTILGSGTAPTRQIFTASGTWTKPSGCRFIKVTCVGGGGAGGGATAAASQLAVGFAGSGGAGCIKWLNATSLTSESVTVGAGGSGGSGAGGSGGASSFGSHCSAGGGLGGVNNWVASGTSAGSWSSYGVAQATATGGDATRNGASPTGAMTRTSGTSGSSAGGAEGPFGLGAGGPPRGPGTSGDAATGFGAGGGAGCANSATNRTGGNGAPGVVIVEEFY